MVFKRKVILLILTIIFAAFTVACGQQAAADSSEAIRMSGEFATKEEQTDYLIMEARKFVDEEQHQDALNVAQYVLKNLDTGSKEAQQIVQSQSDVTQEPAIPDHKNTASSAEEIKKL